MYGLLSAETVNLPRTMCYAFWWTTLSTPVWNPEKNSTSRNCASSWESAGALPGGELELVQRRLIEIRPKIGTYVSLIDAELVEEVRHLRAVLEIDLPRWPARC